jgi:hypothetical protein
MKKKNVKKISAGKVLKRKPYQRLDDNLTQILQFIKKYFTQVRLCTDLIIN